MITFTPDEQALYEDLDKLVDRLLAAHGRRRGAGLVITVYRRRLTSSWQAIRRTLQRRLDRELLVLDEGDLEEEVAEEDGLDTGDGHTVDDTVAVPLSEEDLDEIRGYIRRIDALPTDSKLEALEDHIDEARASGQSLIVFTQFTDTLEAIRDRLRPVYGPSSRRSPVKAVVCGERTGGLRSRSEISWTRSERNGFACCSQTTLPARVSTSRPARCSSTSTCLGTRCVLSSVLAESTVSGRREKS